ncbi:Hypothetical predicted protein [Olea europaea subsp. europaea]|uniref:Uncharacterized protein n=1 Tax=Olea europaea subsp. europaea TaxID=158383 RepID=A0A8S0V6M8_OLEEU|nr:Hypothetical predicted protein [Olea europaea subsp. europaea]
MTNIVLHSPTIVDLAARVINKMSNGQSITTSVVETGEHVGGISLIGKIFNFSTSSNDCKYLDDYSVEEAAMRKMNRSMSDVYWAVIILGIFCFA